MVKIQNVRIFVVEVLKENRRMTEFKKSSRFFC